MVTPSRWFAGGQGPRRVPRARCSPTGDCEHIVDYPRRYDAFPGVKINGGVSLLPLGPRLTTGLRDPTIDHGMARLTGPSSSPLPRVPTTSSSAATKRSRSSRRCRAQGGDRSLDRPVSSQQAVRTSHQLQGCSSMARRTKAESKLFGTAEVTLGRHRSTFPMNSAWVDEWKVLMTRRPGHERAVRHQVPQQAHRRRARNGLHRDLSCGWSLRSERGRERLARDYLRTRFVRFLVSLRKSPSTHKRASTRSFPICRWTRSGLTTSSTSDTASDEGRDRVHRAASITTMRSGQASTRR